MDDLKKTVARNIAALRTNAKLTQAELAEKLGYSDKSISKWERGEAVPDVYVIKNLSEIFDVSVDYILEQHSETEKVQTKRETAKRNHMLICMISIIGIFLLATVAFTAVWAAIRETLWIIYVDSLPICFIVLLVLNSVWFKKRNNLYIISLLIWSLLTAFYLTLLVANVGNLWLVFVIGIPAQIVTLLCFCFKSSKLKNTITK